MNIKKTLILSLTGITFGLSLFAYKAPITSLNPVSDIDIDDTQDIDTDDTQDIDIDDTQDIDTDDTQDIDIDDTQII